MSLSFATGIWVQSSAIAVLTLFRALVLVTSLLAEELDKKTNEKTFPTESDAFSLALDEWLHKFYQLQCLAETRKDPRLLWVSTITP